VEVRIDRPRKDGNLTTAVEDNGAAARAGRDRPVRISLIIASTRTSRFGDTIGRWFTAEARSFGGFDVDIIDLVTLDIPPILSDVHPKTGQYDATLAAFAERVAAADGFVFVTPELNHGYPASLKGALDSVYVEWAAKPATFVSYGGAAGECGPWSSFVRSWWSCTSFPFATPFSFPWPDHSSMTKVRCLTPNDSRSQSRQPWTIFSGGPRR